MSASRRKFSTVWPPNTSSHKAKPSRHAILSVTARNLADWLACTCDSVWSQEPRSSQKPLFYRPCKTQLLLFLGLGAIVIVFVVLFSFFNGARPHERCNITLWSLSANQRKLSFLPRIRGKFANLYSINHWDVNFFNFPVNYLIQLSRQLRFTQCIFKSC